MSDKSEALRIADFIDALDARNERMPLDVYASISSELRRLSAENERLNNALQSEQNRFERIGTHGPGCHTWGHRHYECLLRQYKSLLEALEELCACPQWVDEATVPKAGIETAPQQVVVNLSVALLKLRKARAAIAKATGEAP